MRILAVDQARHGGWSVFDYDKKEPVVYGCFEYPSNKFEFGDFITDVRQKVKGYMEEYSCDAVFIEDIQMQQNVDSFKKLAMLMGSLVSFFIENEYLYEIIPPSRWQGFCNARGRKTKEVKDKITVLQNEGKKVSKQLSIQFVKDQFGIYTEDDNIADSLSIGWYVVNNIKLEKGETNE